MTVGSFTFVPEFVVLKRIQGTYETEQLLSQVGMFGADLDFAYRHATPVLTTILNAIPKEYKCQAADEGLELNIDVRVHELRKGDYPATPGWHCDAPQRETTFSDAQETVPVQNSLVLNVSSEPEGVSNTIFAQEALTLDNNRMDLTTWRLMNETLGADLSNYHQSHDGEMIMFSCFTPHCIQPAVRDGVRLFLRVSQWVKPDGFTPGLTKTEQVYRVVEGVR